VDACLASITKRVTRGQNLLLLKEFTGEEIDNALAQMQPLKDPGPDGFEACFYQKNWSTVGDEVKQATLNFLNNGMFDRTINYTYIALIPKSPGAASVCDYRLISLCNVIYKVIAKTLANRLKQVLPSIISQQQSAFLNGRLITDNVLVAYEALHTMDIPR
jgi:23S rRNA U2552 (ribose-2'-O)-methylase RlmE/FtsJ